MKHEISGEIPKIAYVEVAVMPNGEAMHYGQSLGFVAKSEVDRLYKSPGALQLTKGSQPVVKVEKN